MTVVWPRAALEAKPLPSMPTFTETATKSLVDNIGVGDNLLILKFGYFSRRGSVEYPLQQGLEFLRDAAKTAEPGTHRWYLLNSLYAFAALRTGAETQPAGVEAYTQIFDYAGTRYRGKNLSVEDKLVVSQAVKDFVNTVTSDFAANLSPGDVDKTLSLALAWAGMMCESGDFAGLADAAWGDATRLYKGQAVEAVIGQLEAGPELGRSVSLKLLLAIIYAQSDLQKSKLFLTEAVQLTRKSRSRKNSKLAVRVYTETILVASTLREWDLAFATLTDLESASGRPYLGFRAQLLVNSGRSGELIDVVSKLRAQILASKVGDESDILLIGAVLLSLANFPDPGADTFRKAGEELLTLSLNRRPTPDLFTDLNVRELLVQYLILPASQSEERFTRARAVASAARARLPVGEVNPTLEARIKAWTGWIESAEKKFVNHVPPTKIPLPPP